MLLIPQLKVLKKINLLDNENLPKLDAQGVHFNRLTFEVINVDFQEFFS